MTVSRKTTARRGKTAGTKTVSSKAGRKPASPRATRPASTANLRESEERYRLISEVVSDYAFSTRVEPDGALRLNWVAGAFEAITGYTYEDYVARGGWTAALHPDDLEVDARDLEKIKQNHNVVSTVRTIKKDGSLVWCQVYAHPVWDEKKQRLIGIYGAVQDITERKKAENDLHQKNRALRTYSACNQALAHSSREPDLLNQVCKICVDIGGYRMAWIGYAENDPQHTVRPVAEWGSTNDYLNRIKISWGSDSEFGQGPSGRAVHTQKPQIAQNILTDPTYLPWRTFALEQGYRASIGLPLISGGKAFGVLNIYSAEADAFDPPEVALLADLASDVAFGIEVLRTRAENARTEELLRASEERYRLLVDQSPYAISLVQDNLLIFTNPASARLVGAAQVADILGRRFDSLIHPDYQATALERLQRLLRGETDLYPVESCLVALDGQAVPVEVTATRLTYGGREAIQLIALDITDRKQAEAQIRQASRFSAALLDSLPGIFYFYDQNFTFLRWNKNFETLSGYTAQEITRLSPLDFFAGPDQALVAERIRTVFEQGSSEVEANFVAKDGTQTPYYFTGRRTELDGQPCLIGVGIDINERRQAEQARREVQRQLSLIFDTVGDIIFLINVEADGTYRFASVNRLFLATTGLSTAQVVGKRLEEVLPPSAHEMVRAKYEEAIRTHQPVSWEEESPYPTGTLYGKVTVTPAFDASGQCTNLIGSVHDITDIRRAEHQIRKLNQELEQRVIERTAKLEVANKELESFSYSVSHDLRAPLRAISGFAEIIARRHRASLNPEGQHYFDNIVQASERMSLLIDDLLQYSRLGRQALHLKPIALNDILIPLAKDLAQRLDTVGGTLAIAPNLPRVLADKTLLSQIFTNLLDNAVTYRQADRPLQIAITAQVQDQSAVICVSDNGIGIPAEHHQKIFNIFQRLHSDDEYPGTGIGLATVRKSVEMLGGRVWVESEPGMGSRFFIQLPLEQPHG